MTPAEIAEEILVIPSSKLSHQNIVDMIDQLDKPEQPAVVNAALSVYIDVLNNSITRIQTRIEELKNEIEQLDGHLVTLHDQSAQASSLLPEGFYNDTES
jgi:hypothetical protein